MSLSNETFLNSFVSNVLKTSVLAPSNNTSTGLFNSISASKAFVCLFLFSNLDSWNTFLACSEEANVKSILLIPSIHSGGQIVLSIPAVQPILYFPTGWNSFGTVICIQISGCLFNMLLVKPKSNKNFHSGLSSQNPNGVFPQRWDNNLTLYLLVSTMALIKSLERAP